MPSKTDNRPSELTSAAEATGGTVTVEVTGPSDADSSPDARIVVSAKPSTVPSLGSSRILSYRHLLMLEGAASC